MKTDEKLEYGYSVARDINKRHGKSYYWATQLFPKEKRRATYALYAFFRLADDIVDSVDITTLGGQNRARRELNLFSDSWRLALKSGNSSDPVLYAAAHVCRAYAIPDEHSECFLYAMATDITKRQYGTYEELQSYMDGSAAAVGLMMSHVIGFSDRTALPHLANLGNAMQLTNFLRDVDEDYHVFRRVYIPMEDLDRFGLSEDDIASRRYSGRWRMLMEFEAERIEALYADAEIGIEQLSPDAKLPVRLASVLYSAILGKLREQDWNVFEGRAHTSVMEKLVLTFQTATRA